MNRVPRMTTCAKNIFDERAREVGYCSLGSRFEKARSGAASAK